MAIPAASALFQRNKNGTYGALQSSTWNSNN